MPRRDAVDRRHIDDAAAAVFAHQLAGFHRHEEVTTNVDVHGLLEGVQVGVQHVAELRVGGGVVDQDIQAPELFADTGEHLLDLLHLADVAGHCSCLAPGGNDRLGDLLAAVQLAAGDDHVGALLGQQVGNGFTDAAAGAGNEGDLAVKVEQVGLGHAVFLVVCRQSVVLAMTFKAICSSSRFMWMN
ncbi:hypothetical protein D3C76_1265410 [compost metagenome]